jgi:hypothetical protein
VGAKTKERNVTQGFDASPLGCAWLRRCVSVARGHGLAQQMEAVNYSGTPTPNQFVVLADASSLVSLQYGSMKFCGVHVLGSIGGRDR